MCIHATDVVDVPFLDVLSFLFHACMYMTLMFVCLCLSSMPLSSSSFVVQQMREAHGQRWTRSKSRELTASTLTEAHTYSDVLSKAQKSDVTVRETFNEHHGRVSLFVRVCLLRVQLCMACILR